MADVTEPRVTGFVETDFEDDTSVGGTTIFSAERAWRVSSRTFRMAFVAKAYLVVTGR